MTTVIQYACRGCQRYGSHEVGGIRAANGARHFRARCLRCGLASEFLTHQSLRFLGVDPEVVPILRDNSQDGRPCARCGSCYSEWHHWAPTAVFGEDADRYPGDWLCIACHQEWHARMDGYRWHPTVEASA